MQAAPAARASQAAASQTLQVIPLGPYRLGPGLGWKSDGEGKLTHGTRMSLWTAASGQGSGKAWALNQGSSFQQAFM